MTAEKLIEYLRTAGNTEVRIDGKSVRDVLLPFGGPVNIVSKRRRWLWSRR